MRLLLAAVLLILVGAVPALAGGSPQGQISPATKTTGNGRLLAPQGRLTQLGNFPTGAALTPDRRYAWIVDSGHGQDDVQVLRLADGAVVQTLPLPGGFGGVAISPDGRTAWVSGAPSGPATTGTVKGVDGDVLHVFTIDPATGLGTEQEPIALPASTGGTGQVQSLPPVSKTYPAGVAVAEDGKHVAVALQQADRVALLDVASGAVSSVQVGAYPTTVQWDHHGRLWVANLYSGSLTVVDAGGSVLATVGGFGGELGDRNAHPAGMAMDPTGDRLYVAVAQRDALAVVDTEKRAIVKRVSVGRDGQPLGVSPVDVAADAHYVYVADANEDTVAVLAHGDRPARAGLPSRRGTVFLRPSARRLRAYARARAREAKRHRAVLAGRATTASSSRSGRPDDHEATSAARPPGAKARRAEARRHRRVLKRLRKRIALRKRTGVCGGPTRKRALRERRQALRAIARHRRLPRARRAVRCVERPGYLAGLKDLELIGKLPTAAYPATVEATGDGTLLWIAAKGFGTGANPQYFFDGGQVAGGTITTPVYGQYVLDAINGIAGRTAVLQDAQIRAGNAAAVKQAVPTNAIDPPANTPIRPGGPIKHVFLIVRENRTYDQVFGTDPRGDGDPARELFDDNGVAGPTGGITPNAHALTRRFPLLDHVYSNSEVSVDGHLITTGSFANDYVQKATAQNYSRPGKSYDFGIAPVTFGPNFFVFDQAVKQSISFANYGEEAAGLAPYGRDGRPTYDAVVAGSNVAYPGPVQIGCLGPAGGQPTNLVNCFQDSGSVGGTGTVTAANRRVDIFNAQFSQQLASGSVPAFNYLVVPNDHTNGTTPGAYSPQALIADNDLALGQIVELISHSSVWDSSVILVEEDDSQDGADHVDAHRQPVFAISPYTKGGVEVPTRYDQYSIMATVERILGLKPLSINDGLATPMYDAFISGDEKPNLAPYEAIQPEQPLNETNPSGGRLAPLSAAMPFVSDLDLVPQAVSDAILYTAVHGTLDGFKGPGPGASSAEHARAVGALRAVSAGRSARAWLVRHGGEAEEEEEGEGDADERPRMVRMTAAQESQAAAQARGVLEAIGR